MLLNYRHKKTDGLYTILHHGWIEATETEAVIYVSHQDGRIWVRPSDEFYDGRFEIVVDEGD